MQPSTGAQRLRLSSLCPVFSQAISRELQGQWNSWTRTCRHMRCQQLYPLCQPTTILASHLMEALSDLWSVSLPGPGEPRRMSTHQCPTDFITGIQLVLLQAQLGLRFPPSGDTGTSPASPSGDPCQHHHIAHAHYAPEGTLLAPPSYDVSACLAGSPPCLWALRLQLLLGASCPVCPPASAALSGPPQDSPGRT